MKNYILFLLMLTSVALSAQRYPLVSIDSTKIIQSLQDTSKYQIALYGTDEEGNFYSPFIPVQEFNTLSAAQGTITGRVVPETSNSLYVKEDNLYNAILETWKEQKLNRAIIQYVNTIEGLGGDRRDYFDIGENRRGTLDGLWFSETIDALGTRYFFDRDSAFVTQLDYTASSIAAALDSIQAGVDYTLTPTVGGFDGTLFTTHENAVLFIGVHPNVNRERFFYDPEINQTTWDILNTSISNRNLKIEAFLNKERTKVIFYIHN